MTIYLLIIQIKQNASEVQCAYASSDTQLVVAMWEKNRSPRRGTTILQRYDGSATKFCRVIAKRSRVAVASQQTRRACDPVHAVDFKVYAKCKNMKNNPK